MTRDISGGTDTGSAQRPELLDDHTRRLAGGGVGRRIQVSSAGAVAGTFLVVALAFGAAIGPLSGDRVAGVGSEGRDATTSSDKPASEPGGDRAVVDTAPDATDKHPTDATTTDGKDDGATTDTKDGAVEPTDKPAEPTHEAKTIDIGLGLAGHDVVVEWSACDVDGFAAYKIIRSTDEFATWPLGSGDTLVGVVTDPSVRRFVDRSVAAGRKYFYRVAALQVLDGKTVVGCRSAMARISTPAPEPTTNGDIALTVVIKEGHPFLDWSECGGLDFDYFKVVRSTDATVTWPKGENDTLVAAIGRDGNSKLFDADAPAGKKLYYRVFCVRSTEAGYVAVAASAVKGVVTPAAEPAPDPVALGFEVNVTGEGVVLNWQASAGDGFAFYKVLRSTWNEHPSYLPYVDGTEVIGVIENRATNQLTDTSVTSGQTIYYRVQAIGMWNGAKVLLGQTAVIAVTIP
ncbi:MAG: hypothetical protein EPO00_05055 [Chloroflexota bacterium]|nr:MAG: hypothetical protein EPO00_05055 [Chloroflexota bacterium]